MGGVDCLDQMLGTYQYPHQCLKWYHTLYHRVREIALVNGFILYKKANPTKRVTPKKFREEVISGLLMTWNPPQRKTGCPSNTEDPLRLTGRHYLGKNENPKQKLDCRVCCDRKNKKRVQTVFYCKQCNIPMCFERYHTLHHYDRLIIICNWIIPIWQKMPRHLCKATVTCEQGMRTIKSLYVTGKENVM